MLNPMKTPLPTLQGPWTMERWTMEVFSPNYHRRAGLGVDDHAILDAGVGANDNRLHVAQRSAKPTAGA